MVVSLDACLVGSLVVLVVAWLVSSFVRSLVVSLMGTPNKRNTNSGFL